METTEKGSNQWKLRASCTACGALLRSEDTPLNIERKRRLMEEFTTPPVEATPVAGSVDDDSDDL